MVKSVKCITVCPETFRDALFLSKCQCGKHPASCRTMFKTATRKSAANHQLVVKVIDDRETVRGHGIHTGFQDRRFLVVKTRKVFADVAADFFDIRLKRGQVAGIRIGLWTTVKQHFDKSMVSTGYRPANTM